MQRMTHLHAREVVFDPLPTLMLAHGATEHLVHRQRHIVETAQPRQQRVVLENHRPLRPGPGDFPVITQQSALGGRRDPGDQIQQGRFSAARVADQTDGLPFDDIEGDILQRQELAAGGVKALADGLYLN